jgi:uncharacterized protein YjbI with pentapeptide repeats
MGQITIRRASADLPVFDEETSLEPVPSLDSAGGMICDFRYGDVSVHVLEVRNVHLVRGKIRAVQSGRASVTGVRIDSVEFTSCDLSSLRWTGGKTSRVRFDTCRLLGARFEGVTAQHAVFTGCRLDYATFDQVRACGPVIFAGCALREAEFTGCDLAGSLFDDCDLRLAGFGAGSYRGCDLRGNDLSAVSGAHHLKHVVIDHAQTIQLAEALAAELDVTFGDDLSDPPGAALASDMHGWWLLGDQQP